MNTSLCVSLPTFLLFCGYCLQLQQWRRRRIRKDSLLWPTVLWLWTGGINSQAPRPHSFYSHRAQSSQEEGTTDLSEFTVYWPPRLLPSSELIWSQGTGQSCRIRLPVIQFGLYTSHRFLQIKERRAEEVTVGDCISVTRVWCFFKLVFLTSLGNCRGGIRSNFCTPDLESNRDWILKPTLPDPWSLFNLILQISRIWVIDIFSVVSHSTTSHH